MAGLTLKRQKAKAPTCAFMPVECEIKRLGDRSVNVTLPGGRLNFLADPGDEDSYVIYLEVDENKRGQGIASTLYRAAQTWCLANGVKRLHGQLENEEGTPLHIRERLEGARTTLWVEPKAFYDALDELNWESDQVDYTVGDSDDEDAPKRPGGVDEGWFELGDQPKELIALLARMGVQQEECFLQMTTEFGIEEGV